jgi:hypothetical protein
VVKRIYLAGPIGPLDGREERIRDAIGWAERLRLLGAAVFVPHCFVQWYQPFDLSYDECMALDEVWLRQCEALFRMPGKSPGSDREAERAQQLGIPVFTDVKELIRWLAGSKQPDGDWPQIGDDVIVEVSQQHMKRGRVKFEYTHLGERALWCESQWGSFEALASECKRPPALRGEDDLL